MAVTLRLARRGKKKEPHYRIVAAERLGRRDGRFIETVGFYTPMTEPPTVHIKEDRVRRWVENGAQATRVVRDIVRKSIPGLFEGREEKQRSGIRERRKKRKERARARA